MRRPFGLDIGVSGIKVVWLSRKQHGYFLQSATSIPTPGKGMISESALDQEQLAQAIRKAVDDIKITSSYVNIALPENQVYTKVIEMPVLSDKELSTAIYWEAEQHIPVPLEHVTLDWKVLRRDTQISGKMSVLLVGAPNQLVEKYQKILSYVGLTVSAVETEIISAVRSLSSVITTQSSNTPTSITPASIIVQIGSFSTSLAIVRESVILFVYTIPLGGAAINRAIATDFGFTVIQAEEYKKTYGISDSGLGVKINKAAEPILGSILTEVKKAMSYYIERYPKDEQVRQILLSGGNAKLPGIELFFVKNTGIETVIANPWKIISSQQLPQAILDKAPEYSIAVGLAMRDI